MKIFKLHEQKNLVLHEKKKQNKRKTYQLCKLNETVYVKQDIEKNTSRKHDARAHYHSKPHTCPYKKT